MSARSYDNLGQPPDLYSILELTPSATRSEIRSAYHRLAKLSHPDKNPDADPAVFHALQRAYETLSDPEKRAAYDNRTNSSSPRHAHFSNLYPHNPMFEDMFKRMFGDDLAGDPFPAFMPRSRYRRTHSFHRSWPRPASAQHFRYGTTKSPDSQLEFGCSLEDLMNGRKVTLEVRREVGCEFCQGIGIRPDAPLRPCVRCQGQGFIFSNQSMHGVFSYSRSTCSSCHGEGTKTSSQDSCACCQGAGMQHKKETVEWNIVKGMLPGEATVIPGMGDSKPGYSAGDLVLRLRLAPHPTFKMISSNSRDLLLQVSITLSESLLGFDRVLFHHLDGSSIRAHLPSPHEPGYSVIKPGEVRVMRGMGLPGPTNFNPGDLWLKFEVEWPTADWVRAQDLNFLTHALPPVRPDFAPTSTTQPQPMYANLELTTPEEQAEKLPGMTI